MTSTDEPPTVRTRLAVDPEGSQGTSIASWDLLLAVMGAPHSNEMVSTTFRLVEAVLARGGRAQVWACGYATALTSTGLGAHKPRNIVEWNRTYPSTSALVSELLDRGGDAVAWSVCRFCSDERGVTDHIAKVSVRAPLRFGGHVTESKRTLFLGVI